MYGIILNIPYALCITGILVLVFLNKKGLIPREKGTQWIIRLLFLLVFILALRIRIPILIESSGRALDPDAAFYLRLAETSTGIWKTGTREPLFIWILRMVLPFFQNGNLAIRCVSFLLSLILLGAVFIIAKKYFNPFVGFFSAFYLVHNLQINTLSAMGLRFEMIILTILLMFYLLFLHRPQKKKISSLVTGLCGGLILLAYLPNILLVLFTIIVKGIRERWKILHFVTALILTFLICSPYLLYSAKNYGDPLIAVNVHAKWYRNMEFAGKPGFPARADVERNAYCGDSLTSLEYMFKLHSLKEVVERSARGFYYIHWSKYMGRTGFGHSLFLWFYFIGIVLLLTEGKWDFILFFLLISAPLSFVAGSIDMSWRIPLVNIPLAYMLCGYGICRVACAAGKYHTGENRTGKQDKIT